MQRKIRLWLLLVSDDYIPLEFKFVLVDKEYLREVPGSIVNLVMYRI